MNSPAPGKFTTTEWLILTVAAIGFLFDTYELLLLPLIAAPAIAEILQVPPNNPLVTDWVGRLLWLAALSGGVFGLMYGNRCPVAPLNVAPATTLVPIVPLNPLPLLSTNLNAPRLLLTFQRLHKHSICFAANAAPSSSRLRNRS